MKARQAGLLLLLAVTVVAGSCTKKTSDVEFAGVGGLRRSRVRQGF